MTKKSPVLTLDGLFRALSDPIRLRLMNLIAGRDICVCYLVECLGMSQPKISRHLAYLRKAGLVSTRNEGKWVHYQLVEPGDNTVREVLHMTLKQLRGRPETRRDEERLGAVECCSPGTPVQLRLAPRPAKAR